MYPGLPPGSKNVESQGFLMGLTVLEFWMADLKNLLVFWSKKTENFTNVVNYIFFFVSAVPYRKSGTILEICKLSSRNPYKSCTVRNCGGIILVLNNASLYDYVIMRNRP